MRIATILMLGVFALSLNSCAKRRAEKQADEDDEIINKYIADHNLSAVATGSGLYYVIDVEGTGDQPSSSSSVTVAYTGRLVDGFVFDTSTGATFSLNGVIEGWTEGIPYFKEGGSGTLLIPSALGYGKDGTSTIPANAVLVFDVELQDVQ